MRETKLKNLHNIGKGSARSKSRSGNHNSIKRWNSIMRTLRSGRKSITSLMKISNSLTGRRNNRKKHPNPDQHPRDQNLNVLNQRPNPSPKARIPPKTNQRVKHLRAKTADQSPRERASLRNDFTASLFC